MKDDTSGVSYSLWQMVLYMLRLGALGFRSIIVSHLRYLGAVIPADHLDF